MVIGKVFGMARRLFPRRVVLAVGVVALLGALLAGSLRLTSAAAPSRPVTLADFEGMIFVWASGTPEVQALAQAQCRTLGLDASGCADISDATRAAWRDLLARDPAALGRIGARPNQAARGQILAALTGRLAGITRDHIAPFLAATGRAAGQLRDPQFVRGAVRRIGQPIPGPGHSPSAATQVVWATAYAQTQLPPGMTTSGSRYAALPDLYLSVANTGRGATIPTIYQPYYWPGGVTAHWAVTVSTAARTASAANVPITDVGPWNEDDNWWDANGTSATPAPGCPVAATLARSDATSNPLVNGICPNGHNLRRLYYYLLYGHAGLPFFGAGAYAPSGTFADGTAWPAALPTFCAETIVASINTDGMACAGGPGSGYNANHGAWLRDGTNDAPVLNQASIDLSPAVDAALGWTYPSSGLVAVDVTRLP